MPKSKVAEPSQSMILRWLLSGELWRLGIGEDPHWGQRPIDQIFIKAAIHELANQITDQTVRKQVQATVTSGLETVVQKMIKEAE